MFMQGPRPFGQHSTSYRPFGGTRKLRSTTSMTNLPISDFGNGRMSAPPMDYTPANRQAYDVMTTSVHEGVIGGSSYQHSVKWPNELPERGVYSDHEDQVINGRRISRVRRTTSLQQHGFINDMPAAPTFQYQEISVPMIKVDTNSANSGPSYRYTNAPQTPFRESSMVQSLEDFNSRPNEQQWQGNTASSRSIRSYSAVPFGGNLASSQPDNSAQSVKPMVYQQLERHKNYATMHHVQTPRFGAPLRRRTSDPNVLKTGDDRDTPVPVPAAMAMYNVAKGVRNELEHDPKFMRKAETLNAYAHASEVDANGNQQRLLSKQSSSMRQIEQFYVDVNQLRSELHQHRPELSTRLKQAPPTPAPKPFNVEHVRSIFHTPPALQDFSACDGNNLSRTQSMPKNLAFDRTSNSSTASANLNKYNAIQPSYYQNNEKQANVPSYRISQAKQADAPVTIQQPISNNPAPPPPAPYVLDLRSGGGGGYRSNLQPTTTTNAVMNGSFSGSITSNSHEFIPQHMSSTDATPQQFNRSFPVDELPPSATFTREYNADVNSANPPPGILHKTYRCTPESFLKFQKKVAFCCDSNTVPEILSNSQGLNEAPQSVVLYDEIVGEPLQNLLKLSAEIGGDVQEVVQKLLSLFTEQRNFIWSAAGQKEPSANELQAKLSTIVATMCDISTFRDSKRNTSHFHHISAISEGAQAIGWLTVKPTPAPFIKDMTDAAMFFINRVFKECKDDQVHTNWAKAWAAVLNSLQKYVRQAHTTGLTWNSSPGTKPLSSTNSASASAVESLGGPPPPPPMLPPDLFTKAGTKSGGDKADRAALFAELSTGENVTQRLKKVTDDMKTHKNPELRANSGVVESVPKDGKSSSASLPKQQQEQPVSKLPRTWLEDFKRWNVEYYKNDKNIVIEVNMKQAVYIYKCENCVVQIKGKVNTITMDSSKKTSIVFESSVSQVEIINCQSVQIQTLGAMPLLSIQKTDGCQVYLSKEAMNADIITSKSSEMNVLVPAAEDDDFVEYSVPEQFKTIFDGKQLRTTVSEIV